MRTLILALGLSAGLLAPSTLAAGSSAGTAYCFGTACPCGNNDASAGCVNSTGAGALLTITGTSSVAAGDLGFQATSLPPSSVTLMVIGSQQQSKPFKDGMLCIGGQTWRLYKHYNSGAAGVVTWDNIAGLFALNAPPVIFQAGDAWNFQSWYRDSPGNASGCGQKSNLTNAYAVTFTP